MKKVQGKDYLLVQGDCLDLIPKLKNQVDMILCDLPYGITQNKWDSVIPLDKLWQLYKRILKPDGCVVLTASQPFTSTLVMSNLEWFKYEWIWGKNIATNHALCKSMPMKKHENIIVFSPTRARYNPQMGIGKPYHMKRKNIDDSGDNYQYNMKRTDTHNEGIRYPTSILFVDRETGLHPTQKPVTLFEYLIKTYTNESQIVLDNCMGSGTTGVACANTNRRFIGIELDPTYFDIAAKRIADAYESRQGNE